MPLPNLAREEPDPLPDPGKPYPVPDPGELYPVPDLGRPCLVPDSKDRSFRLMRMELEMRSDRLIVSLVRAGTPHFMPLNLAGFV
jgi:hypothetical protein